MVSAPSIAAAARELSVGLERALALRSDAIAEDLEALGLVEWDREQVIGGAQWALAALRSERFRAREGPPILVTERRFQPLESLPAVWRALLSGREVSLRVEPEGSPAVPRLLGPLAESLQELLGAPVLRIAGQGPLHEGARDGGVAVARSRIGLIQADADPELAAYVLAQACLRRCGTRPRAVHWAVVSSERGQPHPTLERHLRRLWLGVRLGDVHDENVFAGPVDDVTAQAFDRAHAWLAEHAATTGIVAGGELLSDSTTLLGPALFRVEAEGEGSEAIAAKLDELRGPILVLDYLPHDAAEARFAELSRGRGAVRIGVAPRGRNLPKDHAQYSGAVLVERLAPGLPGPRP